MSRMSGEPGRTRRQASPDQYLANCARFAAAWLLLLAGACTSSQTSTTAPTIQRCVVTVTNSMEMVPASGAAGTLTVAAARDCTWAASNGAPWVVITTATNGQGDGTIGYRVAANSEPATRRSSIEVNNTAAAIVQEAAECRFTVTPASSAVDASGGSVAIRVQTHAACAWSATSEVSWARITSAASGQGDGGVTVVVEANGGSPRSGRVIVAGTAVAIDQGSGSAITPAPPPPPGCSYQIRPDGQTIAAAGGTGSIDVTASAGTCAWTAVSNTGWITITGGASASGSGRATFSVAANTGGPRTGSISVAGQLFTLTQAGVSCSYSINPSSEAVAAAGGTSSIAVSTGGACAWTAASHASWITVASGATGSGNGTVRLNIAANAGAARTGAATIAAQTFTVTQASAPCSFVLNPTSVDVPAGGGDATTNVTTAVGCAWTATSNAGWITVTGGASGAGNGTVRVNVANNTGAARSGTVTIGGQTFTVSQQAAPCTFAIAPTSQTMTSAGGPGSVAVTTGPSCGWSATSNNTDWLTIPSAAAGTGNGTIAFAAAANGGAQRVGTLTVAGQTFTLTQDAPCTFAINPTSQTIAAAGGSGSIAVTASGSCSWSATSNNTDWLTISSGASGAGSGQVVFNAISNGTGADRIGTISVAGFTFTLTQTAQ